MLEVFEDCATGKYHRNVVKSVRMRKKSLLLADNEVLFFTKKKLFILEDDIHSSKNQFYRISFPKKFLLQGKFFKTLLLLNLKNFPPLQRWKNPLGKLKTHQELKFWNLFKLQVLEYSNGRPVIKGVVKETSEDKIVVKNVRLFFRQLKYVIFSLNENFFLENYFSVKAWGFHFERGWKSQLDCWIKWFNREGLIFHSRNFSSTEWQNINCNWWRWRGRSRKSAFFVNFYLW